MRSLIRRHICARSEPDSGTGRGPGLRLAARAAVLAAVFVALSATAALAQIYVVKEADGTRRFTNHPAPGAELFLETRYSTRPGRVASRAAVPFVKEIAEASKQAGVDAKLVEAVIAAESAFDPNALSNKGAQGLMQLMPDTADRYGVSNVWDPKQNIIGGTTHLRDLIDTYNGDLHHVLAAYNAGAAAVARHGGVPPYPETVQYIDRVMAYYRRLGGEDSVASRMP